MTGLVRTKLMGNVAIVELSDPGRLNALTLEMREELIVALREANLDRSSAAIVLTGSGSNFSAGGDIKNPRPSVEAIASTAAYRLSRLQETIRSVMAGPKPVVAAVDGRAMGAGLSLAMSCDFVIGSHRAQFAGVFGKVGLVPDAGLLFTLPRRIGAAKAQLMLLTARTVEAAEARDMGLVDRLVAPEDLLEAAAQEAARLAQIAPLSMAAIKSLGVGYCMSLEDAFAQESRLQPLMALTRDSAEARAAFVEKRPPNFRGY